MFAEAMDEVHQTPSGRDGGKQIFMFLCYLLAGMKHVTPSRHRCVIRRNETDHPSSGCDGYKETLGDYAIHGRRRSQ